MNKQEIFDKVFLGLKAQGFKQSADDTGTCQYRGPDGMKCAVGHLIPDDIYDFRWDKQSLLVDELPEDVLEKVGLGGNLAIVKDLQYFHDSYDEPSVMEIRIRQFALQHNLKVPE